MGVKQSVGQRFGKYELLNRIAIGGMAEIFLAKQTGLEGFEKLVVIKKILPHLTDSPDFVQMFLDEARIAAQLNHNNIVQIFDLGKVDESYFIAMEFVDGRDLPAIQRHTQAIEKPLSIEAAVRVACGACEGLFYAHTKCDNRGRPLNIVHRDVSPQNILVSYDGVVKVVDFGIAQATSRYAKTRTGVLKGKYAYMSPEQVLGQPVDARSDQFSLGIVLYELTTNTRLFQHPSELMILKQITDGAVAPPTKLQPNYPRALEAIVLRALARDPNDRFSDMREMFLALESFLSHEGRPFSHIDLASTMKALFSDRFTSRQRDAAAGTKVEELVTRELATDPDRSPSQVSAVDATAHVSRNDVTHNSAVLDAAPGARRRRLMGGVAAALVVAAVGIFFATRGGGAKDAEPGPAQVAVLSPAPAASSAPGPGPKPGHGPLGGPGPSPSPGPGPGFPTSAPASAPAPAPATATATARDSAPGRGPARIESTTRSKFRSKSKLLSPATAHEPGPGPRPGLGPESPPQPAATGTLRIDAQPACDVYLGGKKLGETPGDFGNLPSGRHAFRLVNDAEGISRTVEIDIPAGGVAKKRYNFAEKGTVAFAVEPWADVYHDGKMLGKTPMRAISFAPGKYEFKLVNDELKKTRIVTVEVRPGKRSVVKESLE